MRDGTPRTRAELIQLTGLARSTVGARVDALLAAGLLAPSGEAASTGGRPPATVRVQPPRRGSSSAPTSAPPTALVALTDLSGTVIAERAEAARHHPRTRRHVLDWLVRTGKALMKSAGRRRQDLVGVGHRPARSRRALDRQARRAADHARAGTATTSRPRSPPGWVARSSWTTTSTSWRSASTPPIYPHVEHLVFVKVATGIGAGIISGGRLHRGAKGAAGDLGHVAAPHGGDAVCTCGNIGCLEAIASGPAIVKAAARRGNRGARQPRARRRWSRAGDVTAAHAVRQAGRDIGEVLATCVSMLNPSVIVVGGILAQSAESLLAGVREVVYGRSLPLATGGLQIVAARTGDHAGVHRRGHHGDPARAVGGAGRAAAGRPRRLSGRGQQAADRSATGQHRTDEAAGCRQVGQHGRLVGVVDVRLARPGAARRAVRRGRARATTTHRPGRRVGSR